MRMYVFPVMILLLALGVSIWALSCAVSEYIVKKKGKPEKATVIRVRQVIPTGFRRISNGKDGVFSCDYILSILLAGGKETQMTAHARLRIKDGKRYLFFAPGDVIDIMHDFRFPRTFVFMDGLPSSRQGRVGPIILWSFCTLMLLALSVMWFS